MKTVRTLLLNVTNNSPDHQLKIIFTIKSFLIIHPTSKLLTMFIQMFKKSLLLLPAFLLLMAGQACSQDSSPTADPTDSGQPEAMVSDPQFDWFKYEGNDPIYRDLEVGKDEIGRASCRERWEI